MENWPEMSDTSTKRNGSSRRNSKGKIHLLLDRQGLKEEECYENGDQFSICKSQKHHQLGFSTSRSLTLQVQTIQNVKDNWKQTFQFISIVGHGYRVKIKQTGSRLFLCHQSENFYISFEEDEKKATVFQLIDPNTLKPQQPTSVRYGNSIHLYSPIQKKYLYVQKQDRHVTLAEKPSLPFYLKPISRKVSGIQTNYLQKQDTVLLRSVQRGLFIGMQKKKELFQKDENCEIKLNQNYFDYKNYTLVEKTSLEVQDDPSLFLWEVELKSNNMNFFIFHDDQIIFRHYLSRLPLVRRHVDMLSQEIGFDSQSMNCDRSGTSFFSIKNIALYILDDKFRNIDRKPIYMGKGVFLGGEQWSLEKVHPPKYLRLFNNDLVSLGQKILQTLQNRSSLLQNLDELKELVQGYRWILRTMHKQQKQETSDHLNLSIQFLKIIKSIFECIEKSFCNLTNNDEVWKQKKITLQPLLEILYGFVIESMKRNEITASSQRKAFVKLIGSFIELDCKNSLHTLMFIALKWEPATILKTILKNFKYVKRENLFIFYSVVWEVSNQLSDINNKRLVDFMKNQQIRLHVKKNQLSIADSIDFLDLLEVRQKEKDHLMILCRIAFAHKTENSSDNELLQKLLDTLENAAKFQHYLTLLSIIESIYLGNSTQSIEVFQFRKYIYYDHETLQLSTNISSLINYKQPNSLLNCEHIQSFFTKLIFWDNNSSFSCEELLENFDSILSIVHGFLTVGNYTIQFLNIIEKEVLEICACLVNQSEKLKGSSKIIARIRLDENKLSNINAIFKVEQLYCTLNETFEVLLKLRKKIIAYPLHHEYRELFEIDKVFPVYLKIVPFFHEEIPNMNQLVHLYSTFELKQSFAVLTLEEKFYLEQKFSDCEKVIQFIEEISQLGKSINEIKNSQNQSQNISSMILSMKNQLDQIKKFLKEGLDSKAITAYGISERLFSVIITNIHFEEDVIQEVVYFLCQNPPNISAVVNFFNIVSTQSYIMIFAFSLKKKAINQEELKLVQEFIINKFHGEDLLELIFLIQEITPYEKVLYTKLYDSLLHLSFKKSKETVLEYLKIFKTNESVKAYFQNQSNNRNINLALVCLFRIAHQDGGILLKHLSKIISFESLFQILIDQEIPYFIKVALPTYFRTKKSLYGDLILLDDYFGYINQVLSLYTEMIDGLKDYNPRSKIQKYIQLFDSQKDALPLNISMKQLTRLTTQVEQNYKVKKYYWELLFWKPIFEQQEGILVGLYELALKVDEQILNKMERHIDPIYEKLKSMQKIFNQSSELKHLIQKIIALLKEKLPKLKNIEIYEKSSSSEIVSFLLSQNLLKDFISVFFYNDFNNISNCKSSSKRCSTEKSSIVRASKASKKLKRSIEHKNIHFEWFRKKTKKLVSLHHFIQQDSISSQNILLHKSTMKINYDQNFLSDKSYLLDEILQMIEKVCSGKIMLVKRKLEKELILFSEMGGTMNILKAQINELLEKQRNKFLAQNYESSNFQSKMRFSHKKKKCDNYLLQNVSENADINFPEDKIQKLIKNNQFELLYMIIHKKQYQKQVFLKVLNNFSLANVQKIIAFMKKVLPQIIIDPEITQKIAQFIYKFTILIQGNQKSYRKALGEIIEVYCLHESKVGKFTKKIFYMIERKILFHLSDLGSKYAVNDVLRVLLILPYNPQVSLSSLENYMIFSINEVISNSFSTVIQKSQFIESLSLLFDYIIQESQYCWNSRHNFFTEIFRLSIRIKEIHEQNIERRKEKDLVRLNQLQRIYRQCLVLIQMRRRVEGQEDILFSDENYGYIQVSFCKKTMLFAYKKVQTGYITEFTSLLERHLEAEPSFMERKDLIFYSSQFIEKNYINETYYHRYKTKEIIFFFLFAQLVVLTSFVCVRYTELNQGWLSFLFIILISLGILKIRGFWRNSHLITYLQHKKKSEQVEITCINIFTSMIAQHWLILLLYIGLWVIDIESLINDEHSIMMLLSIFFFYNTEVEEWFFQFLRYIYQLRILLIFVVAVILTFTFELDTSEKIAEVSLFTPHLRVLTFLELLLSSESPSYYKSSFVIWYNTIMYLLIILLIGCSLGILEEDGEGKSACLLCVHSRPKTPQKCQLTHNIYAWLCFCVELRRTQNEYLSSRQVQIKDEVLRKNTSLFVQ